MTDNELQQAKKAAIKKLFVRAGSVQVKKEMTNFIRCVAAEDEKKTVMLVKKWINSSAD